MKAVKYHKFGGPEVLSIEETTRPSPNDNEVLIEVIATTVNSGDSHMRSGDPFIARLFAGPFTPRNKILGTTFSGTVAQIGKDVKRFKVGDDVFGSLGVISGTHAEFITLSESASIALKPQHISHNEAASLVFGPVSAQYFLRKTNITENKRVLIIGAAGGVGSYAVQFAKYNGAHVTGVCSTNDTKFVKELGADVVVDYKKQSLLEYVTDSSERFDIIIDTACKLPISDIKRLLSENGSYTGTIISLGLLLEIIKGFRKKESSRQFTFDVSKSTYDDIDNIGKLAVSKDFVPLIDSVYALANIRKAHEQVQSKHKRGAVVVNFKI